ncbi:hypothetical protein DSECCO2_349550 [anaerobic digester metagenome]
MVLDQGKGCNLFNQRGEVFALLLLQLLGQPLQLFHTKHDFSILLIKGSEQGTLGILRQALAFQPFAYGADESGHRRCMHCHIPRVGKQ